MIQAIFNEIRQKIGEERIAAKLGLHTNTVERWVKQAQVPAHYENDLKRIRGEAPGAEDQFFTKEHIARHCYASFKRVARQLGITRRAYTMIEPSAGAGAFYDLLPKARRIGLDVEPRAPDIAKGDFLLWEPPTDKNIVIGNPPFGLRGHTALQFINHAARFADVIAFILPQLFASDGKGVPKKRIDPRFKLAHTESLPADSFILPDKTEMKISTLFQVWTKIRHDKIVLPPRKTAQKFIKIYSLSDGGTPASTRNKHMLDKCDVYLPTTCFKGMRVYENFESLPNRRGMGVVIFQNKEQIKNLLEKHDWHETAFVSTNGAVNLRFSLVEDVVTRGGFYDSPA